MQGSNAVSIGKYAGSVAVGDSLGETNRGTNVNATAIGFNSGNSNQGANSVAVGVNAWQGNKAIVLLDRL